MQCIYNNNDFKANDFNSRFNKPTSRPVMNTALAVAAVDSCSGHTLSQNHDTLYAD